MEPPQIAAMYQMIAISQHALRVHFPREHRTLTIMLNWTDIPGSTAFLRFLSKFEKNR